MVQSMHHRSRLALQSSLLALAASAVLASPSLAQDAPPAQPVAEPEAPAIQTEALPPQTAVVARIQVEGAQRIDPTTIMSYLPIQAGDTVDDAVINLAVRTLFRTDHFSDVQIALQPNGTQLVQVV